MVVISGETVGASALMDGYAPSGTERELLETMSQSATAYRYDSPAELKFELRFRKAVVDSAARLYRGGLKFSTFHKSRCNEAYWDRTDNGGFRLKDGADPAEAVSDIYSHGGRYATECATAMVIVFYGAALEIFGAGVFNKLFPDIYLMNWHDVDPLLHGVGVPRKVSDILYGDRGYFANPDVDPKTPEWHGENVIVLPGGLYYGHGAGIEPAEGIIAILNSKRKSGAEQEAYMLHVAARPDYKDLFNAYGQTVAQSVPAHMVWGPFPAAISTAKTVFT